MEYFECESLGKNNCSHCYRKYTNPVLKTMSFVLMSAIPAANLTFVINWKKIGIWVDRFKNNCSFQGQEKELPEEQ